MPAPKFFRQQDIDIVRQALENCPRDPETNAIIETNLIAEVERLLTFDIAAERRRKAQRMVRDHERPCKTQPQGSLWLPGLEPNAYEPDRLIPDGEGLTVELDRATPHFISASLARAGENLRKQRAAFLRKQTESDAYSEWSADQSLTGRPANETTFGNFVRERGYWRPDPVDGADDGDDSI